MTRQPTLSRRRMVALCGLGGTVAVGGCLDAGGDPAYERGTADVPDDAEERSTEEMVAAEAVAETEIHPDAVPLDGIDVATHELSVEDGYKRVVVGGSVENDGEDRLRYVEVRVRVYDAAGEQLGQYLDSTGDLDAGSRWRFEVVVLESPGDIAEYDIAAAGITA
ncbi:FxLYD domain-containing protein [Haloferacaceae archaeon DSL9]